METERRPGIGWQAVAALLLLLLLLAWPLGASAADPFPSIALIELHGEGQTEAGFRDGILSRYPDARFYVYSAAGSQELFDLQVDVALRRAHDLFYVSGTAATSALLARLRDRPVVFTQVRAPVEEGFIASWQAPEGNATGISNLVPALNQLKALKKIVPFERLGVVSSPDSPDAQRQVDELRRLQPFLSFELTELPLPQRPGQGPLRLPDSPPLDAVYLPDDPQLLQHGEALLAQINAAGLPSVAADMTLVLRHGALLGLVPDNYRIGRMAALSALRILDGTPPGRVPSRTLDAFMVVLNMRTARALPVQVPLSLLVIADTIVR